VKIPADQDTRWAFYEDITRKCTASQPDRRKAYQQFRSYYMYGTDGSDDAKSRYNKIYPHIDMLTSFLYSNETTRFSTVLGVSVSDMEMKKLGPINQGINDEWNNSNTDILYNNALTWSLVYGSTFIKPRWRRNGIEPFVVDPHNFGVLREDSPQLSTQEAFTHTYYITPSQLRNELENSSHPRAEFIIDQCIGGPKRPVASLGPIERIITSASSPNVIGNAPFDFSMTQRYIPKIAEDLIEMIELYVFDDSINDFRVVTLADPYVLVYDRPLEQMFMKNDPPFVQICPVPLYDYFWGASEVERLIPLQQMYGDRQEEIRHMQDLQAHPPKVYTGWTGMDDEMNAALDSPDGYVQNDMPGAKADSLAPQIPADLFNDLDRIAAMFEDMSGINNVMSGKGESGVRSSGHASQLARLGSSRVKKRAMIVEDSLEKLATMYLKIKKKYDDRRMKEDDKEGKGQQFVFSQFTDDFVVKVDAHSNSPIFVEDASQTAFELLKVGAITKERLLELINVPMKQQLIRDVIDVIEPAEQAAHQQEHEDKILELKAKAQRGRNA
jgi:hypothetical protein